MSENHEDFTLPSSEAAGTPASAASSSSRSSPGEDPQSKVVWPPLKGTDLGEYVLLEELGRGGMGIVYKARQKRLDRVVAIKLVMGGQAASREDLELFIAEAQIAAKVRHSNLVGVYGAGQCFGWPYFAMEFIQGTSLEAELADDDPMKPDRAARLIAQVARAVAHLHEHNIVHCDLKPANILLDRDGVPYVSDFGLSRRLEERSTVAEGTVAGTPSYMSPEQAAGRVEATGFASDIYSMGAILYHLLTGQRTFNSEDVSEVINHVVGRAPLPPRKLCKAVPAALEAICLQCLEKDPEARYDSATALAEDLERYLSEEPTEAQPPTLGRRFARWVLREPALAGRTIAITVLLGIEMLWYHVLGISGPRFHRAVMILVPTWALSAYLFQQFERGREQKYRTRLCWAIADVVFLSATLFFSKNSVCSPAVICYPLLVVGSGLWHYVSLVRVTLAMAMVSYGFLWLEAGHARPETVGPYDRHVVFLAGLAIIGFITARLTRRIQILTLRLSR